MNILTGGAMSDEEGAIFENDVDFSKIIFLRKIDERAKDPSSNPPLLEYYAPLIEKFSNFSNGSMSSYFVTPSQINFWKNNSYLIIRRLISCDYCVKNESQYNIQDVGKIDYTFSFNVFMFPRK